jgi:rRNA maturation endonuclease Nob1
MKLECVCGKTLTVPDSLKGEKIRCKTCGKIMKVRADSNDAAPAVASDSPLAVKGSRVCSGCGTTYPMGHKVCIGCGVNLDTGAALYVSMEASADAEAPKTKGKPGFLSRVRRFLGMGGSG